MRNSRAMGLRALASQLPARSKELATSMSRVAAPFSEAVHKIESIRREAPDFKDAKELRVAFDEAHKNATRNALEANEKGCRDWSLDLDESLSVVQEEVQLQPNAPYRAAQHRSA
jgi:hypothetical protein